MQTVWARAEGLLGLQAALVPMATLLQMLGTRVLAAPTFRYCVHILLQLLRSG